MIKTIIQLLWVLFITYYTIVMIPLLLFINKDPLYLSFCYINYLMSKLLGMNLFMINGYKLQKTIILCNHVSMYDILVSFITQIYYYKVFEFCLKKQISYIPGIGWWCKIMGFPILDRNVDDVKLLEHHKTKKTILIFPKVLVSLERNICERLIMRKKNR